MHDSDSALIVTNCGSPLLTLRRGLGVAVVCAVAYLLLLSFVTLVSVGGEPLIARLLPMRETGDSGLSLLRFREADRSGPADLILLGASQAYYTFDPRWIASQGYTSVNLGSLAQVPSLTVHVTRRYVDRLRPQLAIVTTSQDVLGFDGFESFLDLAANMLFDRHIVAMAMDTPSLTSLNVTVSSAVQQFVHPLATARQNTFPFLEYVPGGYSKYTAPFHGIQNWSPNIRFGHEARPAADGTVENCKAYPVQMLEQQLEALRQVLRILTEKHISCVVVTVPSTPAARHHVLNYDENAKIIGRLCADAGVPYKDFNYALSLAPPEDFFDEFHLSPVGGAKTQAAVFEWIKSIGLMPARKSR